MLDQFVPVVNQEFVEHADMRKNLSESREARHLSLVRHTGQDRTDTVLGNGSKGQRRSKRSNTEAADLVARAFQCAPVPLCITGNRVITHCNDEFARMFHSTAAELAGRPLKTFYADPTEFPRRFAWAQSALRRSGTYEFE